VRVLRLSIATTAVAALLAIGAIVAVAAPGAVTRTANPLAGAGHAVYCPDKQAREARVSAFVATMQAARKKYFATHPSSAQRSAFVKAQKSQLSALQRALASCT
jgi:hypothetical protein